MKKAFLLPWFLFLVFSLQGQTTSYKAQSILIYNILKYSYWPEGESKTEITIAVLGDQSAINEMTASINGRLAGPYKISVVSAGGSVQALEADVIYVTADKSASLESIKLGSKGMPKLIITEREDLVKKGAGISFFVSDEGKLRFDVNNTDIKGRSIKLSKDILGLADKVI